MNCNDVQGALVDAAYGEASPELAGSIDGHVAGCEACRQAKDQLGQLTSLALPTGHAWLPTDLATPRTSSHGTWLTGLAAIALGLGSLSLLSESSDLSLRTGPVSAFLLVAWTGLYAWLFGLLDGRSGEAASGRAVAYGVLVAVAASLASVWMTLRVASRFFLLSDLVGYALPGLILLSMALTLLAVGVGFGLVLKESTRPNVPWVLAIYLSIMLPVLVALPTPQMNVVFATSLLALWGLSGAFVGSFLGGWGGRRVAGGS